MISALDDGVWWIRLRGLPYWTVNAYLVDDGGALTLVDTGLPWNVRGLSKGIRAAGYTVDDIDRVLITHYDLDHFGGLLLARHLDVPVYTGDITAELFSGKRMPPLLHHKGAVHRILMRLLPSIEVTPLADGDTVGGFTAYHCPGHNPGHTAYLHTPSKTCFLGDLVRGDDDQLCTPVVWDNYSVSAVRESISTFADRVPTFERACPGHGGPIETEGYEALQELAASRDRLSRFTYISLL